MFVSFKNLGKRGRLGNQLFQIAATVGVARKHGCDFVFPPWPFAECFSKMPSQSLAIPEAPTYREQRFSYQDIDISQSTDLVGFFQSEKYFKHCEPEVRELFVLRPDLAERLRERFGALLEKKTCSLHVRRGSYVHVWHEYYADLALGDYYERAIQQFDADTTFVVFSDEIPWCKYRFRGDRFVFIEGMRDIEDLFLMSWCQSHIIANSSFSWWGAWLDPRPGKRVIAPASWFAGERADPSVPFRPETFYRGYHDTRDLIPEGWARL